MPIIGGEEQVETIAMVPLQKEINTIGIEILKAEITIILVLVVMMPVLLLQVWK